MNGFAGRMASALCFALLAGLFVSGCATTKIDWASRVGNYTYDQAVLELGPPDKYARLADGAQVAEWLTSRGSTYAYGGMGHPYYPWYYGYMGPTIITTTTSPDHFIRLIFGPDGRLQSWKKFYR